MLIIARTLAVLSVLLTLVAIEIVHIVKVRARSGKRAGSFSTVLLSGISLLALAALMVANLLEELHP